MELRTRSRVRSYPRLTNHCTQCGDIMFMPEWSEYLSEYRVRHLWSCDTCGYRFETVVGFPEAAWRTSQGTSTNIMQSHRATR